MPLAGRNGDAASDTLRRRAVLLAPLALAACGFAPALAPGGAAEGLRGDIAVDPPVDAEGYALVRRLEERLGLPQAPRYRLSAALSLDEDGLGITPDRSITRFQVGGTLRYSVQRIADDAVVAQGTLTDFTAYAAPVFDAARGGVAGNTVSVLSARGDARARLMVILADDLVTQLVATAPNWRGAA